MKKYKNNLLFKNIFILLITGVISKLIGMIGKIIYTRSAGLNIVSIYALLTPTFMLIITIIQFSFPITISKLSAEEKYDNNSLLKNAYIIGLIIDIIISIIILLTSNIIANMLHMNALKYPIIVIIFITPFITISSIQKGFLHGKEDMFIPSISNIIEEIIKIILIIIVLPIAIKKSNITAVSFLILFNIVTELASIYLMNNRINKKYKSNSISRPNKKIIKDILNISIPTTSTRLISSLGFFLEPILLTTLLIKKGYTSNYITIEYGIINSYVLPLLLMPTFFSISVASALLPNITKLYKNKLYKNCKNKIIKLLLLSIAIGIFCLTFIYLFTDNILKILYKINVGQNYIRILAPFFILIYIQPTLSTIIQAGGKTKKLLKVSIISMIIKYSTLTLLCLFNFGIKSLIIAIIVGIITTTIQEIVITKKIVIN